MQLVMEAVATDPVSAGGLPPTMVPTSAFRFTDFDGLTALVLKAK